MEPAAGAAHRGDHPICAVASLVQVVSHPRWSIAHQKPAFPYPMPTNPACIRSRVIDANERALLFARGAHHLDGGLVAVHENLPSGIKQQDCIGAPLEQLLEHGLTIGLRAIAGTGPFVPFQILHRRIHLTRAAAVRGFPP